MLSSASGWKSYERVMGDRSKSASPILPFGDRQPTSLSLPLFTSFFQHNNLGSKNFVVTLRLIPV
jgi:hypothetical protein